MITNLAQNDPALAGEEEPDFMRMTHLPARQTEKTENSSSSHSQ